MAKQKYIPMLPWFKYLKEQVAHQSIYLWGAQGQDVEDLTLGEIVEMETSKDNAAKVLKHLSDLLSTSAFKISEAKAFDCSGLGCYYLMNLYKVITWDHTAEAFRQECIRIPEKYRQPGDFVFSSFNSDGEAGHIGYITEDGTVTEAKGRLYGVVNRDYKAGGWNEVGRPVFWLYEMKRDLKKGCKGNDVGQLQARLKALGYDCGEVDNDFGNKTEKALLLFQSVKIPAAKNPGVMDSKTAKALHFNYI